MPQEELCSDQYQAQIPRVGRMCMCAKPLQLCLTFCDPMDCSPPGSSLHGILQARILEWVAISSSRGSSRLRDRTRVASCLLPWQVDSLPLAPPGKPREDEGSIKLLMDGGASLSGMSKTLPDE